MSKLDEIALKIIKEQELIIGPIAWKEASKVPLLHINQTTHTIAIDTPDGNAAINNLVSQYEHFFGRAAREVCKEAASSLVAELNPTEVPTSLQ